MSLEVGGRADKIGNTYEDHYLVWLYILLFREKLQSVIVEPLGDEGEGVEYIAQHPDGRLEYYQCKRSNAAEDKWRICDLDKYKVFSRSRQHLGNHPNALYHFISPLPYDSLDELCNRARTNSSLEEFESFQLNSKDLKTLFPKCCSSYGFIHEEETGREQTKELLSRSFFETIPDTPSRERELESWLSLFFSGDSVQLLALLSNYANEKKHYGKPIIATDLVSFLTTNNYVRRLSTNSPSVVQKIKDQNDSYYQMYRPIQRQLFRREATQDILHYVVDQNESVIVHGKPGSGKSGCIQELIDSFKEQEIPYLAIKLDKNKPEGTADQFGHSMDLPDSPVFCLHRLAGSRLSVLILDQLDSLRWTELHSSKSLEICKALIAQAKVINQHQDGNVRIVFVCRTFDLETDQGLKQLFESQSDESETWQKVSVGLLSNDEVKAIVGPDYDNLSLRLQKLLQTPSSLYFWLQVRNAGGQTGNIATTFGLLQEWWRQVPRRLVGKGINKETIIECKDKIVQAMGHQERHTIPRAPFIDYDTELEALASEGIISINRSSISFVHQSIYDFFSTLYLMERLYNGESMINLIGSFDQQTPLLRYRMLMVLQNLFDYDEDDFIKQSQSILESTEVHYYYQCMVFEVIGQIENPSDAILSFVGKYYNMPEWKSYIEQTVLFRHPGFVHHVLGLVGGEWIDEKPLQLLGTIVDIDGDFVASALTPHALIDGDVDAKIFNMLRLIDYSNSNVIYDLQITLAKQNPQFLFDHFGLFSLVKSNSSKLLAFLEIILDQYDDAHHSDIYLGEKEQMLSYAQNNSNVIITSLLEKVCIMTTGWNIEEPEKNRYHYREWYYDGYHQHILRWIVDLIKEAIRIQAKEHPEQFKTAVAMCNSYPSLIAQEIVVAGLTCLPDTEADYALTWLMEDFDHRAFVFTDDSSDALASTKKLIKRFSSMCSSAILDKIEKLIYYWHEPINEIIEKRSRYREYRNSGHGQCFPVCWGHMQKELLPCIHRLSPKACDLLQVLNRNELISVPAYKPGTDMGPAKIVTSPVSGHADKLSDRQWLRIIEKPMETDPRKYHPWKETKDCYIETSPDQFASSLSSQAKKEPERFARMAMHFPADCYHGYIIGVMDGIAFCSEEAKMPPIEIMVELIKKYAMLEPATELAACRIIEHFPDNQWPEWIWRMLLEYTGREDDRITPGTYTDEGERKWTYSELGTAALNSVPGEAVEAIAKICWDNPEAQAYFLDHVYTFIHDPREVIRFSAFNCAMAFFNLKEPISRDMIKQLINEDVRFITAPGIAQIINRLFIADVAFYQEKLITASQINNHDVSKDALRFITDLAILHHDQRLLDYLQQGHFSADQVNTICHEAAHYFDDNKYNSLCKELIMPHIAELKSFGIAELYRSNKLHLERDRDFLIAIMRMNQDPYIVNHFLEYIDESDADLEQYAEIIYAIGMSTAMSEDHHGVWGLVEHVSNCTIKLFDRSKENAHIRRMCLEIWDALFRNQHTIIKRIAETLDEGLV